MKKRILIVIMLIFMTLIKSGGFSNRDFKNERAVTPAYKGTPVSSPCSEVTPELTATPDFTPLPLTSSTTINPAPASINTHAPTSMPVPETSPILQASDPNSVSLNPFSTMGPLVDSLPLYDVDCKEALSFKHDMISFITNAEIQSGISSTYGVFIMKNKPSIYRLKVII